MSNTSNNRANYRDSLVVNGKKYYFYNIKKLGIERLPFSLKIILENLVRHLDTPHVKEEDIKELLDCADKYPDNREISFMPSRVLLQDFTGVPAVVDLAAMRDAMVDLGGDPENQSFITCRTRG